MIRRRDEHGYLYFMANLGAQPLDDWVSLPVHGGVGQPLRPGRGAAWCRPDRGARTAATRRCISSLSRARPIVLRTHMEPVEGPTWHYLAPAGPSGANRRHLARRAAIDGGPTLPRPIEVAELGSWTEWAGDREALRAFSGTARYSIWFDKPAAGEAWALKLGTVCHSARVRLNGQDLGTVYARPYRIHLPDDTLTEGRNRLEIDVTNLMANRMADLDRRKVQWRTFFFVDIRYQPFDASGWEPLPSGLLGPVQLVPLRRLVGD